ncbi:CvpA family protein [Porphyrobacter sp. GA68]|uniref:CvpA family protein n=1 Tax=Porphyrobacter sp. GA68 TaxID=2883480 RepID=UPI001D18995C|nr:CvpA family protein [Porphyrobacter sp. GA68]
MTGLDYILLLIVGVSAVGGFMRGLVQEMLSLAAWFVAVFAIRLLHTPATQMLAEYTGDGTSTAILAFLLLLLIPYFIMRFIANKAGATSRKSVIGPVDRVLGLGFGLIKGFIIVVLAFSLLVLGYDTIWGAQGRPDWITTARSYSLVDASSRGLVEMIAEHRARLLDDEAAESS